MNNVIWGKKRSRNESRLLRNKSAGLNNNDAILTDKYVKYCSKCRKCWQKVSHQTTNQNTIELDGNNYMNYYIDFPAYGKEKKVCLLCSGENKLRSMEE